MDMTLLDSVGRMLPRNVIPAMRPLQGNSHQSATWYGGCSVNEDPCTSGKRVECVAVRGDDISVAEMEGV
jgi:hypothetical protein